MSSNTGEAVSSLTSTQPCHHFSIAEIQSATDDFDSELVIGEGGFGKVYKGCICIEETSHVVAIKRLDSMSNQGAPEFRAEIEMLSKLRHCHLVSLIGFCDDNKEMILVYEYMSNGTLYHHLHKADTRLNWVQRLKIALGAARGLDYLHTGIGTQHGVIHRDIKSSNILLDKNWEAIISDFGLSKVGPTNQSISYVDASVKGTFGYLDPEYFYTRRLTRKTDVFAFGVVLFELLSRRHPVDISFGEEQCSLVRWAQKCVKDRKLDQIVDSSIRGTIVPKCLTRFAQIAYRCLQSEPKERPSMTEVVASLQLLLELQEKHDNISDESSLNTWFTRKIHKYLVPTTTQNSDQSGTSSQKIIENHKNQPSSINKDGRDLKQFTYSELQCATKNFGIDTCLVDEGRVKVYKGLLDKGIYSPSNDDDTGFPIAIKRIQCYEHFDLDILKEVSHPNLVKLIGFCLRFKEVFLVYEFMPLGNFEDCLYDGIIAGLPLVTKVKIAIGIARGIAFLRHTQAELIKNVYRRTNRKSWFDRHKTFLDEDLTDSTGVNDDNDYHQLYNPWSCKEPFQPSSCYNMWTKTLDEYELDRRKILLDEDFTAKLSNYNGCTEGGYPTSMHNTLVRGDYYPGCEPSSIKLETMVFMEVLIGRKISNSKHVKKIEDYLCQHGRKSLVHLSEECFKICNEVDSESRMLKLLEKYAGPVLREGGPGVRPGPTKNRGPIFYIYTI